MLSFLPFHFLKSSGKGTEVVSVIVTKRNFEKYFIMYRFKTPVLTLPVTIICMYKESISVQKH